MNELIRLMEKVENPGTFSVSGKLDFIPPGLKVEGIGIVSLPLIKPQAKSLIGLCEQAPFGRGEDTIVDTKVRNVWQLSPDQFELTNPEWEASLQEAVTELMGKPLGLSGCKIKCEPYKLLIYEKGSFFKSHRDTEKIPNMFATLVVNLPSEHKGGELIVSHGDQSQHYSFADKDLLHPYFLTFYADCYHEVKPITAGYRICLIYNLAIVNRKKQPLLSQASKAINDINAWIKQWTKTKPENPLLCYLLEHSYSEQNICLANLKNGDFAKASVLLKAAEQNHCQAFLCLVSYCRISYGETAYYGRYSYNNDLTEDDFEEEDVEREEIYAHALITSLGETVKVKKLYLEEDQLLANIPLLEGPGRDVSVFEATGNEGATKELWYHRGAVILWPKSRDLEMVSKMDINYGIHYLKTALQKQDGLKGKDRPKIIQLADHILSQKRSYDSDDISPELIKIGDIKLLQKYIHKQISSYYSLSQINAKTFVQIAEKFGWKHFEADVQEHLSNKPGILDWLKSLLLTQKSLSSEGTGVIKRWFEAFWKSTLQRSCTIENLSTVLQLIAMLKIHEVTDDLLDFLSTQQQSLFLTDIYGPSLVKALKLLNQRKDDPAILEELIEDVLHRVEIDFSDPPTPPTNMFREGALNCNCEFCTQVNEFLSDPGQCELRFDKTLKRDLLHVQSQIEQSQVDLEIKIIRAPPKFQGTCRKNQNKFDNQLKLFNRAQKIVKDLQFEYRA